MHQVSCTVKAGTLQNLTGYSSKLCILDLSKTTVKILANGKNKNKIRIKKMEAIGMMLLTDATDI